MVNTNVTGYAGDMTPDETWETLKNDEGSILLDVRTIAEWVYVGVADLSRLGKETVTIEWKTNASNNENASFIEDVKKICPDKNTKLLSLCRSGQRSIATSRALTSAGFNNCYNVLEGFEGDKDSNGHRGTTGGWKFHGLPWKQN